LLLREAWPCALPGPAAAPPIAESLWLLFALPAALAPVRSRILSQFSLLRELDAVRRAFWLLLEFCEFAPEFISVSVDCVAEADVFDCDVLGLVEDVLDGDVVLVFVDGCAVDDELLVCANAVPIAQASAAAKIVRVNFIILSLVYR